MQDFIPVLWLIVGIAIFVFLNVKLKVHNLIGLLIVGIFVAFAEGMVISKIVTTVQNGVGSVLDMWTELYNGSYTNEEIIDKALSLDFWECDFNKLPNSKEYTLKCFCRILDNGMDNAVNKLLDVG